VDLEGPSAIDHATSILRAMRRLLAVSLVFVARAAFADTAPVTTADLARAHAPLFKFNAWVEGDASPMNKSEDYYPMSCARFFDELASGRARVTSRESWSRAGETELRPVGRVSVEERSIEGVPRNMAGDEPGKAPLYFHAYGKNGLTYIEYWTFYGMDRCRVKVLGITLPIGGHRGDWEGISVALDASGKLVRAYYSRHGEKDEVFPQEMHFEGEHPVVYVSQGKHASYPEPGVWHDMLGLAPLVEFDEFFRGNGFAWKTWEGRLVDLGADDPAEFAPGSFKKLCAAPLRDWREFKGGWGPDRGFWKIAGSPVGPAQHGEWSSGEKGAVPWHETRKKKGVEIREAAPVEPAPVPRRR